jgi:hypothetical protein
MGENTRNAGRYAPCATVTAAPRLAGSAAAGSEETGSKSASRVAAGLLRRRVEGTPVLRLGADHHHQPGPSPAGPPVPDAGCHGQARAGVLHLPRPGLHRAGCRHASATSGRALPALVTMATPPPSPGPAVPLPAQAHEPAAADKVLTGCASSGVSARLAEAVSPGSGTDRPTSAGLCPLASR